MKKQTLDKADPELINKFHGSDAGISSLSSPVENMKCEIEGMTENEKFSQEFSQNVEVFSDGSSEFKYLLGDEIDVNAVRKKLAKNGSKGKTVLQKERQIEKKFIKLYNRQGHYSAQ